MVTLPTQNDLGFAAPRSSAGQTNINVGARGGTGEAVKYAGRTLEGVLGERKEREDRSELANAKLDFAKKSSEIRRDFSERQDYGVFEQEYETRIQDARAESLGLLSSGRNRDAFNIDSELSILRGGDNIHKMARGLEVDKGRADLQGMMSDTRGLFLGSDDPAEREEYQRVVQDGLQSAVDNGYISETERLSQGQKYVRDLSRGMLDTQDAQGKLDMLDNDKFMDFLDPDEKAVLRGKAEKELKAEARELEAQAKDNAWSMVASGANPDSFSPATKAMLGGSYNSMRLMHKNLQKRDSPYAENSDKVALAKALALPDAEMVELDLAPLKPKMTEGDYASLVGRQDKARNALREQAADPKMSGSIERSLKRYAPFAMKWGSSKNTDPQRATQNLARDVMYEWASDFVTQNKRKPTEEEIRSQAALQMVEVEADPNYWVYPDTFKGFEAGDLTEEQKAVAKVPYDTINRRVLDDIVGQLEALGVEPTEDLVEQLSGAAAVGDRPRALTLLGIREQ